MKNLAFVIIAVGLIISLGIMASTTSAPEAFTDLLFTAGLYFWVAFPFIVLGFAAYYIHRNDLSRAAQRAILLTSAAVTAASAWLYWTSIYQSTSSTSALVFLFLPLYSLVSIAVLYGAAYFLFKLAAGQGHRS